MGTAVSQQRLPLDVHLHRIPEYHWKTDGHIQKDNEQGDWRSWFAKKTIRAVHRPAGFNRRTKNFVDANGGGRGQYFDPFALYSPPVRKT